MWQNLIWPNPSDCYVLPALVVIINTADRSNWENPLKILSNIHFENKDVLIV